MKVIIGSLILILAFTSCDVTKKRDRAVAEKNNSWYLKNYTYADGNGNRYEFNKNSFEYFPVSASESSSGNYDGGQYIKKQPQLEKFYKIVDLIQSAYEAKADHIQNREMGTGSIKIHDGKILLAFIIKYRSEWQQMIEAALADLKREI